MRQKAELRKENGFATLYVDGKPFVGLGGELHNSSASSTKYMREKVWPNLRPMNINSVVATVSWEQIEPEEGVFDFTELDDLIADAGKEGVKLTLIWFGLWKNGASQPSVVFPYPVDAFPEADRAALYEGIPYSGQKELSRLLEDYLS